MAALVGHRNILPGLEESFIDREVGDNFTVTLPPERAYGLRQEGAQQRVPIKHLLNKGRLKPGQQVLINTEQGRRHATLLKVGRFNVDVDTNHPLAGKTLTFDVTVLDVREATAEERAHGHAHGVGGHHH
jgi:FKBP-type peptidyl-prolyl cis-trans isomerase SlyD